MSDRDACPAWCARCTAARGGRHRSRPEVVTYDWGRLHIRVAGHLEQWAGCHQPVVALYGEGPAGPLYLPRVPALGVHRMLGRLLVTAGWSAERVVPLLEPVGER